MPSIPPTILPSNEVKENESAPIRQGTYPPARDPIIIPIIIIDFRDMVVIKIDVYSHVLLPNSKSLQNYCSHCRMPGKERDNCSGIITD
jgi:hypothetical protein